jgi:hypothetical protein
MNLDNYLTMSQLEDATGLKWSKLRNRLKTLGIEGVLVHPRLRMYPKDRVQDLINYPDHRKRKGP